MLVEVSRDPWVVVVTVLRLVDLEVELDRDVTVDVVGANVEVRVRAPTLGADILSLRWAIAKYAMVAIIATKRLVRRRRIRRSRVRFRCLISWLVVGEVKGSRPFDHALGRSLRPPWDWTCRANHLKLAKLTA